MILNALEGRGEVDRELLVYLGGPSLEDDGEVFDPIEACAEGIAEPDLSCRFILAMLNICAVGVHISYPAIGADVDSALSWESGVVRTVPEEFEDRKAGQAGDGEQGALRVMHAARARRPRVASRVA